MVFRDRYGWPVERIKGRPITNFIRLLLHTNFAWTFRYEAQLEKMRRLLPESHMDIEERLFGVQQYRDE